MVYPSYLSYSKITITFYSFVIHGAGGICKEDLKRMMAWVARTYDLSVLEEISSAPPTVCCVA